MSKRATPGRDPYAFSLGGLRTIASFVPVPVVSDERLNQQRDDCGQKPRRRRWLWLPAEVGAK